MVIFYILVYYLLSSFKNHVEGHDDMKAIVLAAQQFDKVTQFHVFEFTESILSSNAISSVCSKQLNTLELPLIFPTSHKLKTDITNLDGYDSCVNRNQLYVLLQLHWPLPSNGSLIESPAPIKNFIKNLSVLRSSPHLNGICIPTNCYHDLRGILQTPTFQESISPFNISIYSTSSSEDDNNAYLKTLFRLILFVVPCLSILSTISRGRILPHFNLRRNIMAAFEEQRSDTKTSFLNGYRTVYTMISTGGHLHMPIIAGARASHIYLLQEYINQTGKGILYNFILNISCFGVTVNFVTSGCLAVLTLFSQFDKMKASGRTFSLSDSVKIILIRALRTLPGVAFAILLTLSLPSALPFNLTGPLTPSIFKNMTDTCMNHGWKEMTFTANILHTHPFDMCLPIAWFISADMQIFVASLFIIVALYYKRIIGLFLVVLQIILGVVLTWRQNSQLKPPTFIFHDDLYNSQQLYFDINLQTATHITSYGIGILLGLAIYRGKQRNGAQPGLSRGLVIHITGAAFMSAIGILKMSLYDTSGVFKIDSYITEMALSSTLRLFVSCGFATMMYGLFLEPESEYAKFWYIPYHRIIARISFSIFMTHILIIAALHGHARQPDLDYTDPVWQLKTFLVLVASLVPGFIMFVLVEVPSINIIKSLIQGPKRKGHAVSETNNNTGTVTKDKKGQKEL